MNDDPLFTFKSHIEGKNADVAIYSDRIEWAREGRLGRGAKLALGAATLGTSLLKTGVGGKTQGTEMIPVKAMSSVTTKKAGLRFTAVHVIAAGNTVDFRVSHGEADQVKTLLTSLILGSHPSQQAISAPRTAPPPPPTPAAPAVPAAWLTDPQGRHELRYWNGTEWTEHVSDAGETSIDLV